MLRRSTLIILVVFLVLATAAILLQRTDFGEEPEPTPTEQVRLFTIGSDELTRISLENREGEGVTFEKNTEGVWQPQGEGVVIGDMTSFNNALTQIGTLRALSVIQNPPALDVMGLEPPEFQISITSSDGTTQEIEIGTQTPTSSGYYVRTDSSGIVVVSQFNLDTVLDLINSPDMIATPTPEVTSTLDEVSTPEGTLESSE